jgi:hypothetical protein
MVDVKLKTNTAHNTKPKTNSVTLRKAKQERIHDDNRQQDRTR